MIEPTDPAFPGLTPDECVIGDVDDGILGSVSTAPRATAQRRFANELGIRFQDVSCTVKYLRFLTRQEVWDDYGCDRWANDLHKPFWSSDDEPPEPPEEVPAGYEPDEYDPSWTFCSKDHPEARRVHICEERFGPSVEGVGGVVTDYKAVERVAEAMRREMDRWPSEMIWSSTSRVPMGGMRVTISAGGLMVLARVAIVAYRSELLGKAEARDDCRLVEEGSDA